MKKNFFLLSSVFISLIINAQKFDISLSGKQEFYSTLYTKTSGGFLDYERTQDKNQFGYTFKLYKVKFGIKLIKYDMSMNVIKEAELFSNERKFGPFEPSIHEINDKIYLIYYQALNENISDSINIFSTEIDTATLSIGEPKLLITIDQKNTGLFASSNLEHKYTFIIKTSLNKRNTLFLWTSNLNNDFFISVRDEKMNKLWDGKQVINKVDWISLQSACIDNKSNVTVGYVTQMEDLNYTGHVALIKQGAKPIISDIKLNNGVANLVLVLPSQKMNLINIAGTYSAKRGSIIGVYSETLSIDNYSYSKPMTFPFPDTLVKRFANDELGSTKEKNYGLQGISLELFELEDSSLNLLGHYNYRVMDEKGGFTFSGSILNIRLTDGIAVFSRIPKRRISNSYRIGDSYFPWLYKKRVIVFYTDSKDNLKRDISKPPSNSNNYSTSVLVAATISEDGEINRETILDLSDDEFLAIPEKAIKLSPSSFLIPVQKLKGMHGLKKESMWGTVSIK